MAGETYSDFLTYCPFHGNNDTPSFSIGNRSGLYICFNPSCGETGNLTDLIRSQTGRNEFEAVRLIAKMASESGDFSDQLAAALEEPVTFSEFNPEVLRRLREGMAGESAGRLYMHGRGFTDLTIDYFELGYSGKKDMVAVPVHSPNGLPVGIVGRGVQQKTFKNSKGLPRNKTLFNIHRAKRQGDIVIVTEASFDAMRVHQAGFPNVVATLGGHLSPANYALLDRYFQTIIIMTDFDDKSKHVYENCRKCAPNLCGGHNPGRELGSAIATTLSRKNIQWALYDRKLVYPHGAKDAGDLTDDEIAQCINNCVNNLEYSSWGLD